MPLPTIYDKLSAAGKRAVRLEYVKLQDGLCWYCKCKLSEKPPLSVRGKAIDWSLFPPMFLRHPVHLHHSHDTGLTIGAVHSYCNAVLWQYHGE